MTNMLKQVTALPSLSTPELRAMWKDLFQATPPPYNKQFLVKRLAFRIQELAFGGITDSTEERLAALAADEMTQDRMPPPPPEGEIPISGTRLIREWKGVEHCCTVLEDGFEYQGQRYKSLSAVARAITGTRWNGKVFFALKKAWKTK